LDSFAPNLNKGSHEGIYLVEHSWIKCHVTQK